MWRLASLRLATILHRCDTLLLDGGALLLELRVAVESGVLLSDSSISGISERVVVLGILAPTGRK